MSFRKTFFHFTCSCNSGGCFKYIIRYHDIKEYAFYGLTVTHTKRISASKENWPAALLALLRLKAASVLLHDFPGCTLTDGYCDNTQHNVIPKLTCDEALHIFRPRWGMLQSRTRDGEVSKRHSSFKAGKVLNNLLLTIILIKILRQSNR